MQSREPVISEKPISSEPTKILVKSSSAPAIMHQGFWCARPSHWAPVQPKRKLGQKSISLPEPSCKLR